MGYMPLPRSCFKSDEEYRSYVVWAMGKTWLGRRYLKKRFGAERAGELVRIARPAGGYLDRLYSDQEGGA